MAADYNWTDVGTPQGRERLKELLKGMKSPDFVVGALSYKPGERHLVSIWPGKAEHALYSLDKFLNDAIPIKEFLDPSPRLEPSELQWSHNDEESEAYASQGGWTFYAAEDGVWNIHLNQNFMDGNFKSSNGTMETAKAAIHEWRVNHLKSMTGA